MVGIVGEMHTAKTRDAPTRRLRRLGSVVAGVVSTVLLAAPVLACDSTETGSSTCGPLWLEQTGEREVTVAIDGCYMRYADDSPENRAGAHGEAWLEGPSGFRHDFETNCLSYQLCQVERQTVSIPGPGVYVLWSHTWGYTVQPVPMCFDGVSSTGLWVSDVLTPPQPAPVPPPQPGPVPPPQPNPVPPQEVAPPTPVPTAPTDAAPGDRPPAIGQGATFNSPANAYELVAGATVAVLRDLTLWDEPAVGESETVLAAGSLARIVTGATAAEGWYWYQLTDGSLTGWVKGGTGSEANLNAIPFIASSRPSVVSPTNTPNEDPAALLAGAWSDPATRTIMLAGIGAGIVLVALVILWPGGRRRPGKPPVIDPQ